jgi:predicted RNA-binding Zn ribbon-like protein
MRATDQVQEKTSPYEFDFSGGALCLDFCNSVGDRPRYRQEHLKSYEDLLNWTCQAALLDAERIARLAAEARRHPRPAAKAFAEAIELRESLYRIFSTLASGKPPARRDLATVNRQLSVAMQHLEVAAEDGSFRWSWCGPAAALDQMLWPVVYSAAELLITEDRVEFRECASDRCSWLFLDQSRTRRRKWCDMSTCGNRAKARRHYERQKRRAAATAKGKKAAGGQGRRKRA